MTSRSMAERGDRPGHNQGRPAPNQKSPFGWERRRNDAEGSTTWHLWRWVCGRRCNVVIGVFDVMGTRFAAGALCEARAALACEVRRERDSHAPPVLAFDEGNGCILISASDLVAGDEVRFANRRFNFIVDEAEPAPHAKILVRSLDQGITYFYDEGELVWIAKRARTLGMGSRRLTWRPPVPEDVGDER